MDLDYFPLSAFEVDCDGSACSSTGAGRHIHPPQDGEPALCRVRVVDGKRVEYSAGEGIDRLVMA
jgi:hypothetical protein